MPSYASSKGTGRDPASGDQAVQLDLLIDRQRLQYLLNHRLLLAEDIRCPDRYSKRHLKRLLLRSALDSAD